MFESREALLLEEMTTFPMWATLLPLESGFNRAVITKKVCIQLQAYCCEWSGYSYSNHLQLEIV